MYTDELISRLIQLKACTMSLNNLILKAAADDPDPYDDERLRNMANCVRSTSWNIQYLMNEAKELGTGGFKERYFNFDEDGEIHEVTREEYAGSLEDDTLAHVV